MENRETDALYETTHFFEEDPGWVTAPEMVERYLSHGLTLVEIGETGYGLGEYRVVLHGTLPQFETLYETEASECSTGSSFCDWEEWAEGLTLVPRQHESSVHHSGD